MKEPERRVRERRNAGALGDAKHHSQRNNDGASLMIDDGYLSCPLSDR